MTVFDFKEIDNWQRMNIYGINCQRTRKMNKTENLEFKMFEKFFVKPFMKTCL